MDSDKSSRKPSKLIKTHRELDVYDMAFQASMEIFGLSKTFPREETYSLIDQVRRSSRSVCANLAEAWRKRKYDAAFISKLSDAETEAAETQVWIEYAVQCDYLEANSGRALYRKYNQIIGKLVTLQKQSKIWTLPNFKNN